MNRLQRVSLAFVGACGVTFVTLSHAGQAPVQPAPEPRAVSEERQHVLQALVRKLLPSGYTLDIRYERDPYRWRSAGSFTGVTFFLKGDEAFDKREGRKSPCAYVTFMPRTYDGKPIGISEDQGKIQVMMFPAKLLGLRGDLRVYACRDFGYGLPESGTLSEKNLREVLGIHEEAKESSQQPAGAGGMPAAQP